MGKVGKVKFGPSVWFEKTGPVSKEDDAFICLLLDSHDDAKDGTKVYEVRFPKACVTVSEGPPEPDEVEIEITEAEEAANPT